MNTHDSSRVGTLLDRYLIDLDQRGLDDRWARSLFTEDAHTESPAVGHASLFVTGTRLVGAARRTGETWRLTRLCFELVWSSGSPTHPAQA